MNKKGNFLPGSFSFTFSSDSEGKSLLRKLSKINRPLEISFKDMIKLMYQCELIDKAEQKNNDFTDEPQNDQALQESRGSLFDNQAFPSISLLSGIIPGSNFDFFALFKTFNHFLCYLGTKWCGTGDIAKDYHDLGTESDVDRCCRTHDLCPSKVRPYQKRYELENNSLYTKSHCTCDDMLFSCLKFSNSSAGNLLGTIYFNLVQVRFESLWKWKILLFFDIHCRSRALKNLIKEDTSSGRPELVSK